MANHVDASKGWCCDGRTYHEHASEDGHCCQPEGTQLADLPENAREKAEQRLAEDTGADEAGTTS
jgi:hypothetical protein